jgi:hypothetical protein
VSSAKYQKYYKEMLVKHKAEFDKFQEATEKFNANPRGTFKEFNKIGEEVMEIIRIYVDMLCRTSEMTGYGNHTSKLSDKFWDLVRKDFPSVDDIGTEYN